MRNIVHQRGKDRLAGIHPQALSQGCEGMTLDPFQIQIDKSLFTIQIHYFLKAISSTLKHLWMDTLRYRQLAPDEPRVFAVFDDVGVAGGTDMRPSLLGGFSHTRRARQSTSVVGYRL
jgi:hypothetical protein